jgi:hypothetical protein
MAEALDTPFSQRRYQPAQRAKPGLGPIRQAGKASFVTTAHHDSFALGRKRCGNPVNQPGAFKQRLRLVAAKAPRLTSRQDGSEQNQSNASVATPSAL